MIILQNTFNKYKDYEINIDKNSKKGGLYYRQT